MIEIHHNAEIAWVLVVAVWGNNGIDWHPIGQMVLQQPMLEEQCNWLIRDKMWEEVYSNQYYKMTAQCYPEE